MLRSLRTAARLPARVPRAVPAVARRPTSSVPAAVNVTFVRGDGTREVVQGEAGETLYRAALRAGVDVPADTCNGEGDDVTDYGEGPACRHCHVYIASTWFDSVPRMEREEGHQLDMLDERSSYSRLACRVRLTPELDGMIASVAPVDHSYEAE